MYEGKEPVGVMYPPTGSRPADVRILETIVCPAVPDQGRERRHGESFSGFHLDAESHGHYCLVHVKDHVAGAPRRNIQFGVAPAAGRRET